MEILSAAALEHIRSGNRRAIAQAISAVENGTRDAQAISRAVAAHTGRAHVIGITGPPGAGKSTLINALLGELVARGQRIGVVAVDPSSPITGGAVLGDRLRMHQHGMHENVFIRSIASRGHAGGIARTTAAIVDVLDAAAYDTIIVETVGAGQSEVEIAHVADTRVVVCPPLAGDAVQAIKAGILEIADVLVVNKGDLDGADTAIRDLKDMLRLRADGGRDVAVVKTAATRNEGVVELVEAILAHGARTGHGCRKKAPARAPSHHASGREQQAASQCVMRLAARPDFGRGVGVEVIDGGAGQATTRITVAERHLNFNGTCHGGMLFTLADAAFGLASNSHGHVAAGIDAHMTYHTAARLGDVLTATASEISRSRKIAVYRIDVTREATLVASFTGTVYISSRRNDE